MPVDTVNTMVLEESEIKNLVLSSKGIDGKVSNLKDFDSIQKERIFSDHFKNDLKIIEGNRAEYISDSVVNKKICDFPNIPSSFGKMSPTLMELAFLDRAVFAVPDFMARGGKVRGMKYFNHRGPDGTRPRPEDVLKTKNEYYAERSKVGATGDFYALSCLNCVLEVNSFDLNERERKQFPEKLRRSIEEFNKKYNRYDKTDKLLADLYKTLYKYLAEPDNEELRKSSEYKTEELGKHLAELREQKKLPVELTLVVQKILNLAEVVSELPITYDRSAGKARLAALLCKLEENGASEQLSVQTMVNWRMACSGLLCNKALLISGKVVFPYLEKKIKRDFEKQFPQMREKYSSITNLIDTLFDRFKDAKKEDNLSRSIEKEVMRYFEKHYLMKRISLATQDLMNDVCELINCRIIFQKMIKKYEYSEKEIDVAVRAAEFGADADLAYIAEMKKIISAEGVPSEIKTTKLYLVNAYKECLIAEILKDEKRIIDEKKELLGKIVDYTVAESNFTKEGSRQRIIADDIYLRIRLCYRQLAKLSEEEINLVKKEIKANEQEWKDLGKTSESLKQSVKGELERTIDACDKSIKDSFVDSMLQGFDIIIKSNLCDSYSKTSIREYKVVFSEIQSKKEYGSDVNANLIEDKPLLHKSHQGVTQSPSNPSNSIAEPVVTSSENKNSTCCYKPSSCILR